MAYISKVFEVVLCSDSKGQNEISSIGSITWRIFNGNTTLATTRGLTPATFLSAVANVINETAINANFIGMENQQFNDFYTAMIPEITNLSQYTGSYYIKLKSDSQYAVSVTAVNCGVPWGAAVTSYELYDSNNNVVGSLQVPFAFSDQPAWYYFENISNGEVSGNAYYLRMGDVNPSGMICSLSGRSIELTQNVRDWINNIKNKISDPYNPGGESGVGGGTGNFDGTSDSIEIPGLPTLSAIGTGFVTLYTPTVAQLHNLANYMWNADVTTLDFWKKIVADPIDLILGLNIVPVESTIAGTKSVNVGFIDTGIAMNYTNSQYVEVDCGTINVNEYWGAYLDYSPYTRAEIYLPYCGYHAIDADEIMGKSVTVKYHVDILSGACTAFVKCGESVLYQFSGSCASAIPVTSSQYGDQVIAAATLAAQLASLPAMGAGAAASAVGAAGAMEAVGESADSYGHMLEARNIGTSLADAASTVTKMKPNIARSGAIGNMAGQLAIQTPYLILSRPRQCLPAGQNTYKGYPANITSTLGNLSGFTVVDSIHLENIPCTLDEQNEIDKFLKTGVII